MLASALRPQLSSGSLAKSLTAAQKRPSRLQRAVRVYAQQSEEPSLIERLALPAAALMGAALLFAATPDAAEAARSGGRVGGSSGFSRSAPSRSSMRCVGAGFACSCHERLSKAVPVLIVCCGWFDGSNNVPMRSFTGHPPGAVHLPLAGHLASAAARQAPAGHQLAVPGRQPPAAAAQMSSRATRMWLHPYLAVTALACLSAAMAAMEWACHLAALAWVCQLEDLGSTQCECGCF